MLFAVRRCSRLVLYLASPDLAAAPTVHLGQVAGSVNHGRPGACGVCCGCAAAGLRDLCGSPSEQSLRETIGPAEAAAAVFRHGA